MSLSSLWGIVPYYNPCGYSNRLYHLEVSCERMRQQGLNLLVVAALGTEDPPLKQDIADIVLCHTNGSVLWQKEALINLAVAALPGSCSKVVWIDGDLLFGNPDWPVELDRALEDHEVVQPFSKAVWLCRETGTEEGSPDLSAKRWERVGFGAAFALARSAKEAELVGHVGFAWAARRELLLRCGLYDRFVVGGGDQLFASAVLKTKNDRFLHALNNPLAEAHAAAWVQQLRSAQRGTTGYLQGTILHLWHGERKKRGYNSRYHVLAKACFDPAADVAHDENGLLCWATAKPALHQGVKDYFLSRDESGEREPSKVLQGVRTK